MTVTHLCMNGAPSLHIVDYDSFYEEYVNKVKSGVKLYLVETKTPLFRFFIDLDYTSLKKLERDEIVEIVKRIHERIGGLCVCSVSSPKQKGDLVKSGIHIHFPNLVVTKKKALKLRQLVPEDLIQFVDESVYKGSGLRMIWSYKRDGGSPYVPFYNVSTNEWLDQQPSVEILKLFSIKTEYTVINETETDSTEYSELETFIRKNIDGQENIKIKGRVENIFQTDSRYCERIRREHKSNHVYFVVSGMYIHQKCHDEECKKFNGRKYRVPPSVLSKITK